MKELTLRCLEAAAAFHKREPLKQGMARGALMSGGEGGKGGWSRDLPPRLVHFIVDRLLRSGKLVAEGEVIRLAGHSVSLASDQEQLKTALLAAYAAAGNTPPNLKDVLDSLKTDAKAASAVLGLLVNEGSLVKVKDGLYYHAPCVAALEERMRVWFRDHDDLDPAAFRDLSGGLSRKYVIALLEYFDRERVTIRVGDKRQIRSR